MDKSKECLIQEINRLKSLEPTQFDYPKRIACLEQRLKNLSDGHDQVSIGVDRISALEEITR